MKKCKNIMRLKSQYRKGIIGEKYNLPLYGPSLLKTMVNTNSGYLWVFESLENTMWRKRGQLFNIQYDGLGILSEGRE